MIASAAVTSGLGLFYWAIAARLYPPSALGLNSAAISAMLFVSGLAQLSLNGVFIRFLPISGTHTKRFVVLAYVGCLVAALGASLIFLAGASWWAPWLAPLQANPLWSASFVLATMAWTIFSLQDSVLTGLRQAQWVPFENALYAAAKILVLVWLSVSFQESGIFVSWVTPVVFLLLPVNALIFGVLIPKHVRATAKQEARITRRQILGQVGGNYFGTIFFLGSTTLLPVLVTNLAGIAANAYFYPAWIIASALQLVALNMSVAMTVETSFDETKLAWFVRRVLVHNARLVLPLVGVILIAAPFLLNFLGPVYAEQGTLLLRLLALAAIPNIFVAVAIGLARVQNRAWLVTCIQGALCVSSLGLSYLWLPVFGLAGVGMAWLVSQSLVGFAALWMLSRVLRGEQTRNKVVTE